MLKWHFWAILRKLKWGSEGGKKQQIAYSTQETYYTKVSVQFYKV